MRQVLIIEFNNFHEEVIYPQIEILTSSGFDVRLFINEKNLNKGLVFKNCKINPIKDSRVGKIQSVLIIIIYSIFRSNDFVVFNSINNKYIKLIDRILCFKKKKIGIIHDFDKFVDKKMLTNNYFVLSENVFKNVLKYNVKGRFSYFYPLIHYDNKGSNNDKDKINIIIPGLVELSRRDYLGFMELLKNTNGTSSLHYEILGNINSKDGLLVLERIKKYNLERMFTLHDTYIPYGEYFRRIASSDLIMPLIHPNVENYAKYCETKISATFNMGFSFGIPFLMYKTLAKLNEFNLYSISYDFNNFNKVVENIDENELEHIRLRMKNDEKFKLENQCKRFIGFLEHI